MGLENRINRAGKEELWFTEELYPDYAQSMLVKKVLAQTKTEYQDLLVFDTDRFGRVLVLDNNVQTTYLDEFVYHESMVHAPLCWHPNPQKVLIIGGGDGGILREVVKHKCVKEVDLVEIDAGVIDYSKEFMPLISKNAFNDLRAHIIVGDGAEFVKHKENYYDVIIVDSSDPVGPAVVLYEDPFCQNLHKALKDVGVIIRQTGSCVYQPDECVNALAQIKRYFADGEILFVPVPTYIGNDFTLTAGFKGNNLSLCNNNLDYRFRDVDLKTRFYSPEMHKAAMVRTPEIERRIKW